MKSCLYSVLTFAMVAGSAAAIAGDGCSSGSTAGSGDCSGQKEVHVTKVAHRLDDKAMVSDKNIVETAVAAGKFKTLAAALKAAGLIEVLEGKGPFTVFAPTDEAFAKLGTATIEDLLKPENKDQLVAILTYHVVPAKVLAKDVRTMGAPTVNGQRIDVVAKDGKVMVDNATVIMTDVIASNGVIHAIETVLMPSQKTVVQTAMNAGNFKTLCKLLAAADWVEPLNGPGPFTVFAPTDEAFAKLDSATLESLLKPENKEKLASILKYHVVKGRIYSDQAVKAGVAKTAQGHDVKITSKGGTVMINDAKVVKADLDASNGVIHVIDTVIMPN